MAKMASLHAEGYTDEDLESLIETESEDWSEIVESLIVD